DDLQLFLRHLDVDQTDDVEQPRDVRCGVGDDQDVRLAVRDQRAPRRDEWAQERAQIVDRRVLDGDDLGDDLVGRAGRVRGRAGDRRDGALARTLDADDLVEVPRLDGREAVHLEDGQQDTEHLFLRDAARSLHRNFAADVGRQDVVEADDLARRLDDGLDIGVVEIEDDEAASLAGRDRRGRGRLRGWGRRAGAAGRAGG